MRRDDAGGGTGFHDLFDSVRRSISFRPTAPAPEAPAGPFGAGAGGIGVRISSCLRKSRGMGLLGLITKSPSPPRRMLPPMPDQSDGGSGGGGANGGVGEENPLIRWRKGELIGAGAFGQVYLGMNLDSGELLAVKQVLIGTSNATREKAQAHIKELEEEVKLLKNLSHPNIVRYLGTVREEDTLNILLEFVPGGSIQSLLGKLGSFPEPVIKKYTKQILQGLEYLHSNAIIHRDIKGANILVDNKGCIKLADFGASKQVAKLATVTAAKTMKGTPYWMAPEVIVGSGHSFSADIWSVGCTVIEMATGKPPWSQQYQEVALLFHVGTTKSHPPIPEHLSQEAKDFLLKCLQKEPELRSTAPDLLKHPFVTGELDDLQPRNHAAHKDCFNEIHAHDMPNGLGLNHSSNWSTMNSNRSSKIKPLWEGSCDDVDMCEFADKDEYAPVGSSYNPMSEPFDNWENKFDTSPEQSSHEPMEFGELAKHAESSITENDFTCPVEGSCEDDVLTESKIKAFLEEKALDLKKLQTPLYEEFYNTVHGGSCQTSKGKFPISPKLPPRGKSPPSKTRGGACDTLNNTAPESCSKQFPRSSVVESSRILREIASPQLNEFADKLHLDAQDSPSISFTERQRKWKEELDQELERERVMRLAGCGKTPSPNRGSNVKKECHADH
ncbi:mitogen-activated protein kinase kinase kinase NPK1 [Zea mays]|uniref:mitogen-activated protein kinase kinase kinase n=1 Tax=Zea mays TaxID=4577 RepID=A0A1D6I3P4_MAIZE|nr:mitogen-activated protein kinase kinase kinase NPK1 [Zea mays]ONM54761.1 NPK1-related protein kinase 2 [Zea mays]|eukprot:XP_008652668.1 mitogen-activated protein kinase kinase kinase NPK1 [Zea mays]